MFPPPVGVKVETRRWRRPDETRRWRYPDETRRWRYPDETRRWRYPDETRRWRRLYKFCIVIVACAAYYRFASSGDAIGTPPIRHRHASDTPPLAPS